MREVTQYFKQLFISLQLYNKKILAFLDFVSYIVFSNLQEKLTELKRQDMKKLNEVQFGNGEMQSFRCKYLLCHYRQGKLIAQLQVNSLELAKYFDIIVEV